MKKTAKSYAKINLGLQVLGKRPDGYHDINSIFVLIDLFDEVMVESISKEIIVECTPQVTASADENIVYMAANLLKARLGNSELGVRIILKKNIPTGSGLGGGSSNAATVLKLLKDVWPGVTQDHIAEIAPQLGSDVPFFLQNSMALISGRGEVVEPFSSHLPWSILLAIPKLHIDTTKAYSTLGITRRRVELDFRNDLAYAVNNQTFKPNSLINDFESVAITYHTVLSSIKTMLTESGCAYVSLSGSGSSMYGLYTSVDNARSAADVINSNLDNVTTYICAAIQAGETE